MYYIYNDLTSNKTKKHIKFFNTEKEAENNICDNCSFVRNWKNKNWRSEKEKNTIIKNNIKNEISSCFDISSNVAWDFSIDSLLFTKEEIEYLTKYHMEK